MERRKKFLQFGPFVYTSQSPITGAELKEINN